MKRWSILLLAVAMPLSSPLACGGDGCLRNSDCAADKTCSSGECVLKSPPAPNGGEGGEDSTPVATSGSGGNSGSGGGAAAGSAGVAGSAGTAGVGGSAETGNSAGEGGDGGMSGAGGQGGVGIIIGLGGDVSSGGV